MSRRRNRLTRQGITGPRADGLYSLDLRGIEFDPRTSEYLSREQAKQLGVLPISFAGRSMFVAAPDNHPTPLELKRKLEELMGMQVELLLASPEQIETVRRQGPDGGLID